MGKIFLCLKCFVIDFHAYFIIKSIVIFQIYFLIKIYLNFFLIKHKILFVL